MLAQGNVIAGAQLAEFFADRVAPENVVFYGCAGALRPQDAASAFLVEYANYMSLGTVQPDGARERVTLKNKWLCDLDPPGDVEPLSAVAFPLTIAGRAAIDVRALSGLPVARVVATDKVLRVRPEPAPAPMVSAPPRDLYAKDEWTYSQALGLWVGGGGPVLVEMESYGIGRIAQALHIADRVVVLRVTTDTLADHADSDADQQALLIRARHLLGRILAILFDPTTTA
jgi:nucleoside phosphorylase